MNMLEQIMDRKKFLEKLIEEKRKELTDAPSGFVRGIKHKKGWQYYYKERKGRGNGKYIKKSEITFARTVAQRGYDEKVLYAAEKEIKLLEQLEKMYQGMAAEQIYQTLPKSHQAIVVPMEMPADVFIRKWMSTAYEKKGFINTESEFYSERNERMRSKSEVLIANRFNKNHILYLYEKPLILKNYGMVHPDFTILDVSNRRELYWEHFGMMDDREYREKALEKIRNYEENGIYLGERLFITTETIKQPLNMRYLEKKIRKLARDINAEKWKVHYE